MKKKQKESDWKKYLFGGIVIIILFAVIFGGSDSSNPNDDIEVIKIKGMNEINTISTPLKTEVYVEGMGAEAHFTSTANPVEVHLEGMNSIAYLCEGIHTPITQTSGMGAKVIYVKC